MELLRTSITNDLKDCLEDSFKRLGKTLEDGFSMLQREIRQISSKLDQPKALEEHERDGHVDGST